jgi:hypothetical protein
MSIVRCPIFIVSMQCIMVTSHASSITLVAPTLPFTLLFATAIIASMIWQCSHYGLSSLLKNCVSITTRKRESRYSNFVIVAKRIAEVGYSACDMGIADCPPLGSRSLFSDVLYLWIWVIAGAWRERLLTSASMAGKLRIV